MATEMRRIIVAVLAALFAIGTALPVAAAPGPEKDSPWPQFQHDPQRTGRTTVNGPVSLRQKWVLDIREPIIGGLAIDEDGTIYAPAYHFLTAIRPNGTQRWQIDTRELKLENRKTVKGSGGDITAPAIDKLDHIIVGVADGRILGINSDSTLDWTFSVSSSSYADGSSPVRGAALLDDGYCCIALGADDGVVYQVDDDGSARGVRRANGAVTGAPARSAANGTIFWASHRNEIFNGEAATGDRWMFGLDGAAFAGPAIGPDSTAYIGTAKGTLYAIDADGALRWKTVLSANKALRAAPSLGANGTVYVSSETGILYAVNGSTGAVKWEFDPEGSKGILAPALIDGRDNVYVASRDGKVYVLSPSGALFSTFETKGAIVAAMALGADGTLYVGSQDRRLYALEEGDPTAAPTTPGTPAGAVTVQRDFTSGRVYLVAAGNRHWVPDPTTAALLDIGPGTWTDVRPEQLTPIPEGQAISPLREGSLIREPNGAIYVIRNGRREWITSPAAFAAGGYQWNAVINVPAFVAARIPAVLPEGTLVRAAAGSKIYVIEDGKRRWISTLELFVTRGFQWDQVTEASGSFLRSIPEGLPFGVAEGSIVKGSTGNKVYVIESGLRRWIPTLTTFFVRGYRWENLVVVSDEALNSIREGAPLPP